LLLLDEARVSESSSLKKAKRKSSNPDVDADVVNRRAVIAKSLKERMVNRLSALSSGFASHAFTSSDCNESESSAAHSAREPFVGVWRAVSISDTRPDGTEVPDLYLGPHPIGLLIYDASGYMCAREHEPGPGKVGEIHRKPPREELAAAAEGYDTYCATYDVDEPQKRIAIMCESIESE